MAVAAPALVPVQANFKTVGSSHTEIQHWLLSALAPLFQPASSSAGA
jgi:hypothetical protein